MAGASYLLDTVIVAGYFNRDEAILNKMKNSSIYVSSITVGELYFGAYNSRKVSQNLENIQRFIKGTPVLPCDETTADWYGQIKRELRSKGRPIPENDVWIAATATQYGLILSTRDQHFSQLESLTVDRW